MTLGRQSKKEQRQLELARQKRKRYLLFAIPVVLFGLFVGSAIYRLAQPDLPGVESVRELLRNHDVEAEFATAGLPPLGGTHNPAWQNCGIYDEPVDDSLAVHSMEHGAVWLTYRPDLPADAVSLLRSLADGEGYLLLSPYPSQTEDVVATAWGKQLIVDAPFEEGIAQFIDRYRGAGPERGAPCDGGVGRPLD